MNIANTKILRTGLLATAFAGALIVSGCNGPNQNTGTAVGAGGGAGVGALLGGGPGAVIRAGACGGGGHPIGHDMDERERARAEDAAYRAARENRRAEWGDRAGTYGYAEPVGDYYRRGGQTCHDYVQTMHKNGRDYQDRTTICRDQGGAWARG